MRLQFFAWHNKKPMISVIYGGIKLTHPSPFVCPLCGKVAFENYYNIKTHYWGVKDLDDMDKVSRIQCKNNKCKAMFITYRRANGSL